MDTNLLTTSNLSKIKPKLRTEGRVSGNFGRNKVRAGSQIADLGVTKAENISITPRGKYVEKSHIGPIMIGPPALLWCLLTNNKQSNHSLSSPFDFVHYKITWKNHHSSKSSKIAQNIEFCLDANKARYDWKMTTNRNFKSFDRKKKRRRLSRSREIVHKRHLTNF